MRPPLAPSLMRYPEGPPLGYGYRGNIGVPGASTFHEGIDIGVPVGTPVYAVADGRVVLATNSGAPGISLLYQIDPETRIRCNHFSRRYYSAGQSFKEGAVIGLSGNTGASGGPHLHFSVFKLRGGSYRSIDPTPWLRQHLAGTAGTPEEDDMTPEQAQQLTDLTARVNALYAGMFGARNLTKKPDAIKWTNISGDAETSRYGVLSILVEDQRRASAQAGQIAALTELVEQLGGGDGSIDMAAIEAAAERGASKSFDKLTEALDGLTFTVNTGTEESA